MTARAIDPRTHVAGNNSSETVRASNAMCILMISKNGDHARSGNETMATPEWINPATNATRPTNKKMKKNVRLMNRANGLWR